MSRRPRPANATTLLPTLGAAMAAAATQGCESPACGDTRAEELRAHGPRVVRNARNGAAGDALEELAVALGLRRHGSTTTGFSMHTAGAPPVHTPEPRVTAGEPAPVTPQPPIAPEGGARAVTPTSQDVDGSVTRVTPQPVTAPRRHR